MDYGYLKYIVYMIPCTSSSVKKCKNYEIYTIIYFTRPSVVINIMSLVDLGGRCRYLANAGKQL